MLACNKDSYAGDWRMTDSMKSSFLGFAIGCVVAKALLRDWMKYANGNSYYGEFRKGNRHGFGIGLWKDGSINDGAVYVGQWRDNKKEDEGVYFYPDGSRYQGPWKGGQEHGVGVFTYAGKKEKILYENGVPKHVLETLN